MKWRIVKRPNWIGGFTYRAQELRFPFIFGWIISVAEAFFGHYKFCQKCGKRMI